MNPTLKRTAFAKMTNFVDMFPKYGKFKAKDKKTDSSQAKGRFIKKRVKDGFDDKNVMIIELLAPVFVLRAASLTCKSVLIRLWCGLSTAHACI